ncbi:P-loop containing nucleoside triphosphate hydrolase protein [Entophlyctis helioformis]|nr:P-loop containing nucleoside triphosphate hydrolase protein [Entophlyctis helioformis]
MIRPCQPRSLFGTAWLLQRRRTRQSWLHTHTDPHAYPHPHLRPYQALCIEESLQAFQNGTRRLAVSMPVGSGKTVIFAHLIPRIQGRIPTATKTLVLAHREELINQAYRQIERFSPSLRIDVDRATIKPDMSADVIVASVPTLGRANSARLDRYDPTKFKCIIIECRLMFVEQAHHAASESYQRILEYMTAYQDDSHMLVWGCSATLRRHDGLSLSPTFETVVFHKPITEMISSGWQVAKVSTQTSLAGLQTSASSGDFATSSLSERVNNQQRNNTIVQVYLDSAIPQGRKSTLVFAVDIAHINALVDAFARHGVLVKGVHGKSSEQERKWALQEFSEGRLPVLVNCGVMSEGVDVPRIDCIMMARPTKSAVLLQQMLGRGMRKFEGKEFCLVLDFVDTLESQKSRLATVPTLLGLQPTFDMKGQIASHIVFGIVSV